MRGLPRTLICCGLYIWNIFHLSPSTEKQNFSISPCIPGIISFSNLQFVSRIFTPFPVLPIHSFHASHNYHCAVTFLCSPSAERLQQPPSMQEFVTLSLMLYFACTLLLIRRPNVSSVYIPYTDRTESPTAHRLSLLHVTRSISTNVTEQRRFQLQDLICQVTRKYVTE